MLSSVRDKDEYVNAQMALAARSRSDGLTYDEFSNYYASLQFAGALALLMLLLHFVFCLITAAWGLCLITDVPGVAHKISTSE